MLVTLKPNSKGMIARRPNNNTMASMALKGSHAK